MTKMPMTKESPDTVHGRLLEAVHISGYTFDRACGELEWLLDDKRWERVGGGFTDINAFLATIDFSEFKVAIEQRKQLVKRLDALRAKQRSTARLLGVDETTIRRDLDKRPAAKAALVATSHSKHDIDNSAVAAKAAWFQRDIDPARAAKHDQARIERLGEREARRASQLDAAVWPTGKYAVIYADPPWQWDHVISKSRDIANQYPTATLDELVAMRPHVDALALDDCVLLMWTTAQKYDEAATLVRAWGFAVKSGAVWIKPSVGMGYWFRGRHELLILATRGNPPTPLESDRPDSVIEAERRGHSEKPDEVYALVERMFPRVPKVELFARAQRDGWDHATNETELRRA